MENELLNRILAEEDFGKGLIELPEGTAVPEGKVVYFSTRDQKYGAGIMQGTVVYICNQELSRSDDGRYYYSYYLMNQGKETEERYLVPDETVKAFNRLVRNTGLAGCGALKHNYFPGFLSPYNTVSPVYNIKLDLEDENGKIISIPLSSDDISSNGGNDIIDSVFTLLVSIRSVGKPVPKTEKTIEQVQTAQKAETSQIWKCLCGLETNTGNFCSRCGARRR